MVEPDADGTAATAVVDSLVRDQAPPSMDNSDGVLVRVRTLLPEFTGALQRVAEQVLNDPAAASRATIVELAGLAGVRTEAAEDLPAAVRLARKLTPPGGVVLLSPAAPSYGRFRNFEHRSEVFAEAVRTSA